MRKTLAALAVTPLALLALAGPATAARPTVTRTSESAVYAVATGETQYAKLLVQASRTPSGSQLSLRYGTADATGGSTETTVETSTGFSFTIDKGRLAYASLVARQVPASTCTYEGDEQTGCVASTVDASLTWTGQGTIARGGSTFHEKRDGVMVVGHGRGTSRSAAVSGSVTVDGTRVAPDSGELGTYRNFEIVRCTGDACPPPEG